MFLFKSRCGFDRDCIDDDRKLPFPLGWCGAIAWVSRGNGRFVEMWDESNSRRQLIIRARAATPARQARCARAAQGSGRAGVGQLAPSEKFTIDIPGVSDILKLPGLESKELRRERAQRLRTANSAVPQALRWIPPILNKLDDAQDLLFTASVLAVPILKRVLPRLLPFVGWALLVSDLLNSFT